MQDEDLDQMFDSTDFAIEAIWSGGSIVLLVFDNGFADAAYGSFQVAGSNPSAVAPTESLPDVAVGQTFVINDTTYTIRSIEPDSTGRLTRMRLSG